MAIKHNPLVDDMAFPDDGSSPVGTNEYNADHTIDGDVNFGGFKGTNLGAPTADTDAATKAYADSLSAGLKWKAPVRATTTVNGALATAYENGDTIDGVVLATGDRILIKDQTTGAENGIYTVNATGAPTRATDFDADSEAAQAAVFVREGTANADSAWVLTNDGAIVIGTTALVFTQFNGLGQVTAGDGLDKTGNQLDVDSTVERNTNKVTTVGDPGNDTNYPTEQAVREGLNTKAGSSHFHNASDINAGDLALARMQLKKEVIMLALTSGPTFTVAAGTAIVSFRMPFKFFLTEVIVSAHAHGTSSTMTIDVNDDGITLIGGGLSLTTTLLVNQATQSDTIADDSIITIDVDAAGTDVQGVVVYLVGYQIV